MWVLNLNINKGIIIMWKRKLFKNENGKFDCYDKAVEFIEMNKHKYKMDLILVNNGYIVEYKKLIKI